VNYFTTALAALRSALQHGITPSGKPGRARGRWGASDEALCGAFEQSPEGGLLVDPESLRIIAANAVFRRNLGLGDVDLKTLTLPQLFASEEEPEALIGRLRNPDPRIPVRIKQQTSSGQQVNTEILAKRAGISLLHVPFKDGGSGMLRDLVSGEVQVSWFNVTNPVGMMKAGRVRALAVAAPQRLAAHPDVPTMAEVGFPGVRASQWVAAFAPSAVPAEIVETLHNAFMRAASVPEMQEAFRKGGMAAPTQSSVSDARAWLREEMASWKRDIEEINLVVDE